MLFVSNTFCILANDRNYFGVLATTGPGPINSLMFIRMWKRHFRMT
jgi:hypothetical protein